MPRQQLDEESGPFVSVKVRQSLYRRIVELARAEDRSITAVIRRAVQAYEKAAKR